MNGAGGVNEIWGKDGGEREIGGGEKIFAIGKEGEGERGKVKKTLKLSVHTKKFSFEKVNEIFFSGLSVHS